MFDYTSFVATNLLVRSIPSIIDLSNVKLVTEIVRNINYAKKNLFLLEIIGPKGLDISQIFNLLVSDVEYTPMQISGDKRKVGGINVDTVLGIDPIEMSVTAFDDINGTLKKWFTDASNLISDKDGTIGLPDNYAIKIKVNHGFPLSFFTFEGLFRANSITSSLSRRASELEEITMTFSQLDSFL